MLLTFGNTRGFRTIAVALLTGVAALALVVDTADARGRRRHAVAKGGGYSPPYAAIVVDANSGQVLHAAEPDGIRHPASLTKIMTLYLLFERMEAGKIKADTPLKVSAHAASQAPTKLGLKPGQTITADEAIRGLVTRSANDAAAVIAEAIAGDEDDFAKMMTRKARALGMSRTVYNNASGLPDSGQVTTARDQAILGRAIQDHFPTQYRYFSISSFAFRGQTIRNHNRLLGSVQGVDGIKTGYVHASGFNLVSSIKRNNRHLVAVVLGGSSAGARDAKMRSLLEKYISEASAKRTAPMIAEARDTDVQAPAAAAGQMMLASAGSVPYAPPTAAAAATAMPGTRFPVAAAKIERPAPGKIEPAKAQAQAQTTADPIKPILVKTIKVKLSGVQTAALTPSLAHLPVVPAHEDISRTATRSLQPAAAPQPAPVRAAAVAAIPAQPAAAPAAPVQVAVATPSAAAQAALARPVAVAQAAHGAIAPAAPTPVAAAAAPAPAPIAVAAAPAPAPAPAPAVVREVAVSSADAETTFALASAASRPAEPTRKPVARSGWIIQIGAFEGEREAKDRLSSAQAKAKSLLGHADPFTEAVVRDNKTFYRARFAGFEKDSAEAACKYLKRNDFACLTIKN
ncbi:MAG: D-alanyl-D-alanine carboxypeptidase [Rhodoplanes sp.]|uniref:D-alanyl-D-alanine carboxypeptidase n=1 Tax=Rhodoplanes sp. TaxID=1968906 RepID=UPI0017A9B684|nr:D-alanyl-D-alanine carboxypeptidase [Rhodoplanes sp.]NVO17061.1 D-alanyl-D-alanine carboxypeptidase [Rhodoplanes sp.]